jgi:hypothetical protein
MGLNFEFSNTSFYVKDGELTLEVDTGDISNAYGGHFESSRLDSKFFFPLAD